MIAGAAAAVALALLGTPVMATDDTTPPLNAVSSTGGVATATGSSSVTTGDIVTGMNTGHSVDTGGTTNGDITVTVDQMSSQADLQVSAEIGPQVADSSGGDYGKSSTSPGNDPPEYNVNINNRSKNNNKSSATGIGEGGAGGAGGDGGSVNVGDEPAG
jgi:hypothetical protein